VLVAHNLAAWVVRAALVQSQYDSELEKVPIGIVDFGLPQDLDHDYWEDEEHWNKLRNSLLRYFNKSPTVLTGKIKTKAAEEQGGLLKKEDFVLTASIIKEIMQEFTTFRGGLQSPDKALPIYPVCCPEKKASYTNLNLFQLPALIVRKGVDRKDTDDSQKSISSTGSIESSATMFVGMSIEEEEEIIGFFNGISDNEPALIPTSTKRASSPRASRTFVGDEAPVERRSSVRSSSRTRYSGSYESRSIRSCYAGGPSPPASEEQFWSSPLIEGSTIPKPSGVPFEPYPQVESQLSMASVILRTGSTRPYKSVGFKGMGDQEYEDAVLVKGYSLVPSVARNIYIPVDMQQSKQIASGYMQNGDLKEANSLYGFLIQYCEDHDRIDRSYYKMRLQVSQIHYIRGEYKDSEEKLQALLEKQYDMSQKNPSEAAFTSEIAKWLALSQWRRGNYSNAQKTLETCRKQLPDENRNRSNLLSTLALVLASAGAFKRAWTLSKRAIDPENFIVTDDSEETDKDILSGRRSSCLVNHARISYAVGELDEAHKYNKEALEDLNKRLGPKHFITLDASGLEAWLCLARSWTSQAAEGVHRTLREMIHRLGESHPSTLQTLETLVLVYKSEGRYSDAEETATYLLRQNVHKLGESHPQTLKSKTIFAEILLACGKGLDAERTQKEVIAIQERPNAEIDYPGLFFYKTTLANILRENGKWDVARKLSLQVLAEELDKFGNEEDTEEAISSPKQKLPKRLPENEYIDMAKLRNLLESSKPVRALLNTLPLNPLADSQPVKIYPPIIQTLHCLALCEQVRDDADLVFARGILKMITKIRLSKLGTDHQLTVNAQYDLAVNYRLRGKFQKSLTTIKEVVSRRKKSLGSDHPDYLRAKYQEVVALFRLGRWKQATEEQRKVLKAQSFLLGKTHPDTVTSRFTLGGICHSLGRLKEAEDLLNDVIINQAARYGHNHAIVLRSRARRALIYLDAGNFQGAEKEQSIVVNERQKYLKGHNLLRNSRNDQAQITQAAGHLDEALSIYLDLEASLPRHQRHSLGYEVLSNLGSCYFELGNFSKAEESQREIYDALKRSSTQLDDAERLIASTFNLALTVKQTPNRHEEACLLLSEAVQRADETLTAEHPQSKELRVTLKKWQREEEQKMLHHVHTDKPEVVQFSASPALSHVSIASAIF
jgi:tetratricopeptide (TPR) repeat protein